MTRPPSKERKRKPLTYSGARSISIPTMVAGRQVVVRGKVSGVICGQTVALQASSQVDGDIYHMSFAIEKGAQFDGRNRRARSEADLVAVVDRTGTATRY